MKTLLFTLFISSAALMSSGCGVYMAYTQPPMVDTDALKEGGLSRDVVVERLGAPRTSTKNADGTREDMFEYYEGSSSGWKIARGTFHLIADVFTLCLWEIVATPTEYGIRGDKITARADFDKADKLVTFKVLGRETKPLERVHRLADEG